jgi:heme-degrading monooxygenase HmoA
MATIGRRVRVEDYERFRSVYDAATAARESGGFPNELILRNPKDPNDVLIITQVEDVERARAYGQSDEVRERQRASGLLELTNYYPE